MHVNNLKIFDHHFFNSFDWSGEECAYQPTFQDNKIFIWNFFSNKIAQVIICGVYKKIVSHHPKGVYMDGYTRNFAGKHFRDGIEEEDRA
jgi:hypothetical protein